MSKRGSRACSTPPANTNTHKLTSKKQSKDKERIASSFIMLYRMRRIKIKADVLRLRFVVLPTRNQSNIHMLYTVESLCIMLIRSIFV